MEEIIELINNYYNSLKDVTSLNFIERKMRSGHLRGYIDIDRILLDEINIEKNKLMNEL